MPAARAVTIIRAWLLSVRGSGAAADPRNAARIRWRRRIAARCRLGDHGGALPDRARCGSQASVLRRCAAECFDAGAPQPRSTHDPESKPAPRRRGIHGPPIM